MISQMHVKGVDVRPYNNAYIVVLRDDGNSTCSPFDCQQVRGGRDKHVAGNVLRLPDR